MSSNPTKDIQNNLTDWDKHIEEHKYKKPPEGYISDNTGKLIEIDEEMEV